MASGSVFSCVLFPCLAVICLLFLKKEGITASFSYVLKLFFLMLLLFVMGYLNAGALKTQEEFAKTGENKSYIFYGEIYDIKKTESSNQVYIKIKRIGGENCEFYGDTDELRNELTTKIILYSDDVDDLYLGQKLVFSGTVSLPDEPTNPGEFNSRKYYRNKGIFIIVYSGKILAVSGKKSTIKETLRSIREKAEYVYDTVFDDNKADIVKAMLLGVKSGMDKDIKRLYQLNGIAHVLAISGVHIAIIGMWLFNRLRKLIGSYWISGAAAILIVALYGVMTGMAESTTRAVVMLLISLVGKALGRTTDMMTSAGVTCIIMAFANPYIIMDAGFELSFAAVMGIAVINEALIKIFGKGGKIRQSLFVSLSATLATLPIIIYNYYQFPLYSIFLNLIVVPLVSVIIFFSIILGFVGVISINAAGIFAIPVKVILSLYEFLCNAMEKLPFYNINTGHISPVMIIVYYAVIGGSLFVFIKYKGKVFRAFGIILLSAGFVFEFLSLDTKFKVVFLDVGQGDGILVKSDNGTNILIDGGSSDNDSLGEYILMPAIKYYGMATLDYVFVSHGDSDHTSGLEYLLSAEHTGITIKNLVVAEYGDTEGLADLISLAEENGVNIIYLDAGQELTETGGFSENTGLTVKCMFPDNNSIFSDSNNASMVLKIEYQEKTFLLTGDIGEESEEQIAETYVNLDCDVLKVAHHGSKYSSTDEFLKLISPETAVISCGINNSYGHPADETLERLRNADAEIYRTDISGAIIMYLEDDKIKCQTVNDY